MENSHPLPSLPPRGGGLGWGAGLLFAAFFLFYGLGLPPGLAPYRDSGEMVSSACTLGVSHAPGYPLYILLGHIVELVGWGNPAYRLSLFSALCMALAAMLLFAILEERLGLGPALAAGLLWGLSAQAARLARVQEMYAFWALCAMVLLRLALLIQGIGDRGWGIGKEIFKKSPSPSPIPHSPSPSSFSRFWFGFCFLYGLFLANRLDLLLLAPGLLFIALARRDFPGKIAPWGGIALLGFPAAMLLLGANWPVAILVAGTALWLSPSPRRLAWPLKSLAWGLLGLSLYLYLPLRSSTHPWLDWSHTAVPSHFIEALLRTRYGGTLDLISRNYKPGALFGVNLLLYLKHLRGSFGPWLAPALLGLFLQSRRDPRLALGLFSWFWWSGPVFLLLSNMPPNPHAAAIVRPYYLMPDVALAWWIAEGFRALAERCREWSPRQTVSRGPGMLSWVPASAGTMGGSWAQAGAASAALAWGLLASPGGLRAMAGRSVFFTQDYARNVFLSAPSGAVLAAKKDVQLYTLWYSQVCALKRPDVSVVAQGLSGTPWYQEQMRRDRPRLAVTALKSPEDWSRFAALNAPAPVLAAMDCEIPPRTFAGSRERGLLARLSASGLPKGEGLAALKLWELASLRGLYSYEDRPDFFTADLVGDYAQALYRSASELYADGAPPELLRRLVLRAWSMRWVFPEAPAFLGFLAFRSGRLDSARDYYAAAARLSRTLLAMAADYRALPSLMSGLRRALAQNLMEEGVVVEKKGDVRDAESLYRAAIAEYPLPRAHYDLAVLYWKRDPEAAARELLETLRLDPHDREAAKYLSILRARKAPSRR